MTHITQVERNKVKNIKIENNRIKIEQQEGEWNRNTRKLKGHS